MAIKVTLVYSAGASSGFASLGQGMEGGWIGHGLAILSACAKQAGFQVDLIDRRGLRDWEDFRQEVIRRKPDVMGWTMLSVDYNLVNKAAQIVKQTDPSIVTVVGGPHVSVAPAEVLANRDFDYVVAGEGEITFVDLLRAIERGEKMPRFLRGIKPDLDQLPFDDRELYREEWRRVGHDTTSPETPFVPELPPPFVTIIAGRGCFYNCSFCKPAEDLIFGGKTRRPSVEHTMAEIRELRDRYHFASLMIHDDTMTEDRPWTREFCEQYIANGFSQPWFCQARADNIVRHEDMVREMVKAGLRGFFIGFESGSDRVLRLLRKGTRVAQNLAAAKICKKYGIAIWANYMLGIPSETKEEVLATIKMLKAIDPDYYSPSFFTPYPGNDLYDYCVKNDLIAVQSHDHFARNPLEPKIKGVDYDFLSWALKESQRRTMPNQLRRTVKQYWKRYASPRKVVRKVRQLVAQAGFLSSPAA